MDRPRGETKSLHADQYSTSTWNTQMGERLVSLAFYPPKKRISERQTCLRVYLFLINHYLYHLRLKPHQRQFKYNHDMTLLR